MTTLPLWFSELGMQHPPFSAERDRWCSAAWWWLTGGTGTLTLSADELIALAEDD